LKEPTITAVLEQAFQLSPEAARAQREAEMLNAHRYRAERMKAYREWSTPEAIKARQEEHAKAEPLALVRVVEETKYPYEAKGPKHMEQIGVTEIIKAAPIKASKPWYKRLLAHMTGSK